MEILLTDHELVAALLWIEFLLIPFAVYWYLKIVKKGPRGDVGWPGPQGMMGVGGRPPTEEEIKKAVRQVLKENADGKRNS